MSKSEEKREVTNKEIFKHLWPQKCWHEYPWPKNNCIHCDKHIWINSKEDKEYNADLSTPSGMVLILDRLVEMGLKPNVYYDELVLLGSPMPPQPTASGWICDYVGCGGKEEDKIYHESAPLAVFSAVKELVRREGCEKE